MIRLVTRGRFTRDYAKGLVSAPEETRSFTATTSICFPRSPCSAIARKTSRPILPKPLMPIFVIRSLIGY